MKKNRGGFTFIEILVVLSILALLSTASITAFSRNFQRQQMNMELSNFINVVEELDNELGKTITDYKIFISTGILYSYTTNSLYTPVLQNISFNSSTGILKTNSILNQKFDSEFYINNKLVNTYSTFLSGAIKFDFSGQNDYKITSRLNDQSLNDIFVQYFSTAHTQNPISLLDMSAGGISFQTGIIIQNSWGGKKTFTQFSGQNIPDDIQLSFENMGVLTTLSLTHK